MLLLKCVFNMTDRLVPKQGVAQEMDCEHKWEKMRERTASIPTPALAIS